jgi:hypothetical protein
MALVVFQVNIFADQESTDQVIHDLSCETEPGRLSVRGGLCYLLDNLTVLASYWPLESIKLLILTMS